MQGLPFTVTVRWFAACTSMNEQYVSFWPTKYIKSDWLKQIHTIQVKHKHTKETDVIKWKMHGCCVDLTLFYYKKIKHFQMLYGVHSPTHHHSLNLSIHPSFFSTTIHLHPLKPTWACPTQTLDKCAGHRLQLHPPHTHNLGVQTPSVLWTRQTCQETATFRVYSPVLCRLWNQTKIMLLSLQMCKLQYSFK